jgi:hypothetical protein
MDPLEPEAQQDLQDRQVQQDLPDRMGMRVRSVPMLKVPKVFNHLLKKHSLDPLEDILEIEDLLDPLDLPIRHL